MNHHRTKGSICLAALAPGAGLGYEVRFFLESGAIVCGSEGKSRGVLGDEIVVPEPPKIEVVDVEEIDAIFHSMDWTVTSGTIRNMGASSR